MNKTDTRTKYRDMMNKIDRISLILVHIHPVDLVDPVKKTLDVL